VDDVPLRQPATGHLGDDAGESRRRALADPFEYLLVLDEADRPIGWLAEDLVPTTGKLTESLAVPMSPFLDRRTTLKDALSMLLDADVQAGVVVDRHGALLGIVTVDDIGTFVRDAVAPDAVARDAEALGSEPAEQVG
jgi:osmoprotectant transport system ATP-binding protein